MAMAMAMARMLRPTFADLNNVTRALPGLAVTRGGSGVSISLAR
jgi:hypothetical protein